MLDSYQDKVAVVTGGAGGIGRSLVKELLAAGAKVVVAGPGTMCPPSMSHLGVEVRHSIDEVLDEADVIMMLRIQRERLQPGMMSSVNEYSRFYGLDLDRLRKARPDVLVMHPGPINRGVEMTPEVADGEQSVVLEQVTNGVAVRMALLYLLLGGEPVGGEDDAN